jgi:hypothetical protein
MAFFPSPYGHFEWDDVDLRVDRRDPRPPRLAADGALRRKRRRPR